MHGQLLAVFFEFDFEQVGSSSCAVSVIHFNYIRRYASKRGMFTYINTSWLKCRAFLCKAAFSLLTQFKVHRFLKFKLCSRRLLMKSVSTGVASDSLQSSNTFPEMVRKQLVLDFYYSVLTHNKSVNSHSHLIHS